MTVDPRIADLVRRATARALVRDVATALAAEGIPVMPLKGVLLAETVYRDGTIRSYTDVDLLVPPAAFERSLRALLAAGFDVDEPAHHEPSCAVRPRSFDVTIDLHRGLFARGLFDLPTWSLFARGTRDRALFGAEVVLPDPRDQLAHAVGHYAKSRPVPDARTLALDIAAIAEVHALRPDEAAEHLVEHGLARAARLALPIALEAMPEAGAFARAVLARLPPDPTGVRIARIVRARLLDATPGSLTSLVGQHAVDRTLPRALLSTALHAYDTVSRRLS